MYMFVSVVLSILALLWAYIGFSMILPLVAGTPWIWPGGAFLIGTYALQVWRWLAYEKSDEQPGLLLAAYSALGLMCYLMVVAVPKDLVQIFVEVPNSALLFLIGLAVLLNIWSLYIGYQGPVVREVEVKSGLPGSPVHIVQISDLHVGPIIQRPYVQTVVDRINKLKPDILVATGDIGDGKTSLLDKALRPLKDATKDRPGFYIPGNHEYYWDVDSWIQEMTSLGFNALINQGLQISLPGKIPIWLGGVPDLHGVRFKPSHESIPAQAIDSEKAKNRYKILLAHQPNSADAAEKAGFDLMLCGHTHGGQFFPFTLIVGFFNLYSRGMNQHGKLSVYVNVGTGYWGPPLRLGARAEITSFRIS